MATVQVRPAPTVGPDVRLATVDCEHGTTQAYVDPGPLVFSDVDLVRTALLKHDIEEGPRGCRCTAKLWARYGPSLVA